MAEFIEVTTDGHKRFINLDWIEEIIETDGGDCVIYYAFTGPGYKAHDFFSPDEIYDQVVALIREAKNREPKDVVASRNQPWGGFLVPMPDLPKEVGK